MRAKFFQIKVRICLNQLFIMEDMSAYQLSNLRNIKIYLFELNRIFSEIYNIDTIYDLNSPVISTIFNIGKLVEIIKKFIDEIDCIINKLEHEIDSIYESIKEVLISIKNTYLNFLILENKVQTLKIKLDNYNNLINNTLSSYYSSSDCYNVTSATVLQNSIITRNYLLCNLEIYVDKLKELLYYIDRETNIIAEIFEYYSSHLLIVLKDDELFNSLPLLKQLNAICRPYDGLNFYFASDNLFLLHDKYNLSTKIPTFIQILIEDAANMIIHYNKQSNNLQIVYKLEITIKVLKIFIQSYIDISDNKLFLITKNLKIKSLSVAIRDYIIYNKQN